MNPNYLSKDELSYELGIRGILEDNDTQHLRKLFRRALNRELPFQWDYLTRYRTEELYSTVSTKVYELQEWLAREGLKPTDFAARVNTRVRHLRDRLSHLTEAGLCTSIEELACSEALLRQLYNIETLASSMLSDTATHQHNLEVQGSEMGPTPLPVEVNESRHRLQPLWNSPELRLENNSLTSVHLSQHFQKLPNPVSYLIKQLPIVDGNDARLLCDFVLKAINISVLGHIKAPALFEILYPYCRGELLACVIQAIADNESFETFHEKLIKRFVASRQFSLLRRELYERVQRTDESLDHYVRSIREAATALLIKENEAEVVARIVEGLHPNQRARLVFQAPPSTFRQLEQMTIVDRNIAFADQMRTSPAGQSTVNAVLQRPRRFFNQHRTLPVTQVTSSGNQPLCYYCGKPGHFQRNCQLRSASNTRAFTTARTHS
jgi:hypothetical protein